MFLGYIPGQYSIAAKYHPQCYPLLLPLKNIFLGNSFFLYTTAKKFPQSAWKPRQSAWLYIILFCLLHRGTYLDMPKMITKHFLGKIAECSTIYWHTYFVKLFFWWIMLTSSWLPTLVSIFWFISLIPWCTSTMWVIILSPLSQMRQNLQKCLAVNHKNISVQKSLHYFLRIKKVLQNIFPLLNASK